MNKRTADRDEAKQDVTALLEIYGAIDLALEFRPLIEKPDPVERLLPVYMKGPDAYWYRKYLAVSGVEPELGVEAYDPEALLNTMLAALGFLAKRRPKCRMRARRAYAVAAAALAFRGFEEITDELLVAAVLGEGEAETLPADRVKRLAGLLRSQPEAPSQAARDKWWKRLRDSDLNLESEDLGPMPSACTTETSLMDVNGDMDPVPTFKTVLDAPLSFDDALGFFDPSKWTCFPSWCEMKKRRGTKDVRRYREKVSFDCDNDEVLALVVNLDFEEWPIDEGPPKVAILEYKLSDVQPEPCYVVVNEGRLEICELREEPDPLVRITTTKAIKFTDELDSLGLASFLCLVGYAGMVEDLICCATKKAAIRGEETDDNYPDVGFRGLAPVEDNGGLL
jgi:hypothetical protein